MNKMTKAAGSRDCTPNLLNGGHGVRGKALPGRRGVEKHFCIFVRGVKVVWPRWNRRATGLPEIWRRLNEIQQFRNMEVAASAMVLDAACSIMKGA
jgi:hypothetical protein